MKKLVNSGPATAAHSDVEGYLSAARISEIEQSQRDQERALDNMKAKNEADEFNYLQQMQAQYSKVFHIRRNLLL